MCAFVRVYLCEQAPVRGEDALGLGMEGELGGGLLQGLDRDRVHQDVIAWFDVVLEEVGHAQRQRRFGVLQVALEELLLVVVRVQDGVQIIGGELDLRDLILNTSNVCREHKSTHNTK